MAQSKVLVDTNTYLRLAKTIHPLLAAPFGDLPYCLYIIPELNRELGNKRLRSKFPWIDEPEFQANRQQFPQLSRQQSKAIEQTFDFIWAHALAEFPGPSKVDVRYLATAYELVVPVVTDDLDMQALAKEFDISTLSTMELLAMMHEAGHISLKLVDGLMAYWEYEDDVPAKMKKDYKRLFKR